MKKGRKVLISGMALLSLVGVTGYTVSKTYAKYASTVSGTSDTATVAKWAWTINDKALASGDLTFKLDLFKTINDTDNATAETDVTNKKIAPGTSGSFKISIKNDSEVNAQYAYNLTETNAGNIPIEYSTDKTTWKTLADFNAYATDIASGATKDATIYWRWAFDGDDATDTALGFAGTATVSIQADLTLTQVD